MKLNSKQLRITRPTEEQMAKIERKPLYIVLDNVLDTYNIGSIFRLADATATKEVILCGGCETPPNSRLHKAAVGTEEWVPWRYEVDAKTAIANLKSQVPNIKIIAVEQDERSVPLSSLNVPSTSPSIIKEGEAGKQGEFLPVAVVVGHETDGCSKDALDLADVIVEIPMYGVNISLNVHVSAAIAVYKILENI